MCFSLIEDVLHKYSPSMLLMLTPEGRVIQW